MRPRIVILGAGNVATHLASALHGKVDIVQIYNHRLEGAFELASAAGAEVTDSLKQLKRDADLYIISVKDDAIASLATQLQGFGHGLWVHTSGSVPSSAIEGIGEGYGVLYPLQTFSKESVVDMSEVPFFLEADVAKSYDLIESVARLISSHIYYADSDRRRLLHIAAVFACNFANFLWTEADTLLHADGLDITVFRPLIMATIEKAMAISPEKGQTGPARRGDMNVVASHQAMLSGEMAQLYRILSEAIFNHYHKPNYK